MRIAIDFDGTIVEDAYPYIGKLKEDAVYTINKWHALGHYIIINSCRAQEYEANMKSFLLGNKIPFDYINCNLPADIKKFGMDCRKISADIYVDDKQVGGLPTWKEIDEFIETRSR